MDSSQNGKFINEYKRVTELKDDFLLLVAKKDQKTAAISYGDVKGRIMDSIRYGLSAGSMAYNDDFKYSKSNHNHAGTYTKLSCSPMYESGSGLVTLAEIWRSDKDTPEIIKSPNIVQTSVQKHRIGEIKFVFNRKPHFSGLSGINSDDFNGWLIPDGQKIPVSEIENDKIDWESHLYYNSQTQTVDIPLISDFIKFSTLEDADSFKQHGYCNKVPNHKHTVTDLSCRMSCEANSENGDFKFNAVGDDQSLSNGTFYVGDANALSDETISSNVSLVNSGFRFDMKFGNDVEIYPSYDGIPVLVFVGGSRT